MPKLKGKLNLISHFDNCLFVHIPKVAGQSIETVFLERAGLSWDNRKDMLLKPNSDPKRGPPRLAHLTAEEYIELGYISVEDFKNMFKFTFVRNPWDRLVSEYKYRNYQYSFDDFLFKHFPNQENDDYEGASDLFRHIIPQYKFIYDDHGNKLVDFIGKFENLKNDFSKISELITGTSLILPHRNKTKLSGLKEVIKRRVAREHYSHYYNQRSREHVANIYHKDIALFEYQFLES